MDNPNLEKILQNYKDKFYETNKKNTFFTKNQKLDFAKAVAKKFSIDELLTSSIYNEENTNKIHMSYPLIKNFLHPNIYQEVINHVFNISDKVIAKYNTYEMHVDLKGFTITAAQRYSDLITTFCKKYFSDGSETNSMAVTYLYNSPNVIDIIKKLFIAFISEESKKKIVIVK